MSENSTGRTRAQHITVVDALGAGRHGVNESEHLAPGRCVTRHATEVDQLVGQPEGAELLGQGGHQRQPRSGDRTVVIEGHPKARRIVRKFLHRKDAFLLLVGVDFSESHLPNTEGIFRVWSHLRTRRHRYFSVEPGLTSIIRPTSEPTVRASA